MGVFLVILVGNLLLGLCGPAQQTVIPYSDFVAQVKFGNVKSATFLGNQIDGEFVHRFKGQSRYLTQEPPGDTGLIQLLLDNKVQVSATQSPFDWFGNTLNLLSVLFMLLVLGSIVYQLRTGSRLTLGVGQTRARVYTEERPKVTFADVASNEEAKEDLQEIIDFLRDPSRYRKVGARIPHGVLLVGPPGTGKTLIARAVAGEARVPFFSVSATEFVEMFVGVGAARIRDLFERAKKVAPSIIFVDEIDAIGRQRSGNVSIGGNDEREQTLNQLLVEMDGFEPSDNVIVIAATNRGDILDAALQRPGRFDRRVEVGLPDKEGRLAILRLHAGKVALAPGCDLEAIARRTPGFAGADLANLVNEAALAAGRENRDQVTQLDLEAAYDKVVLGARRRFALGEDDRKRVAIHEAGHAIVAYFTPKADPLEKVTIVPRGRALGVTQFSNDDRLNLPESYLRARLATALGGRAAEELALGEISSGAENDIQAATAYARRMVERWGMGTELGPVSVPRDGESPAAQLGLTSTSPGLAERADQEVLRILKDAEQTALRALTDHRAALDALAAALVERETVDKSEIDTIVATSTPVVN
ncbi:MAG: ATP-dependent zinc metalloprotease FtsH [Isosphaeraceae bacterium]